MKVSGFMCLGMKNICENFHCKKQKKLSNCEVNDINIYHSAPGAFE